jgi:hypothetical protein
MESINDNLVAIDMLKDITQIIAGIERNEGREIQSGIKSLKEHLSEFESVYYQFKAFNSYK